MQLFLEVAVFQSFVEVPCYNVFAEDFCEQKQAARGCFCPQLLRCFSVFLHRNNCDDIDVLLVCHHCSVIYGFQGRPEWFFPFFVRGKQGETETPFISLENATFHLSVYMDGSRWGQNTKNNGALQGKFWIFYLLWRLPIFVENEHLSERFKTSHFVRPVLFFFFIHKKITCIHTYIHTRWFIRMAIIL